MSKDIHLENQDYEDFIRTVFNCGRNGDPLHLADTDINNAAYSTNNIDKIKHGIAYSLERITTLVNNKKLELSESEQNLLKKYISKISNAKTYTEVHDVIKSVDFLIEKISVLNKSKGV